MWLLYCIVLVVVSTLPNYGAQAWQVVQVSPSVNRQNILGADMFRRLNQESHSQSDNVIIPVSVESVLLILQQGAGGSTAFNMAKNFGFEGKSKAEIAEETLAKSQSLFTEADNNSSKTEFQSSNVVLIKPTLQVKPSFERYLHSAGVEVLRLDQMIENSSAIIEQVNEFSTEKTRGKIPKLLEELPLEDTEMMILNTVYLKSPWRTPFDSGKIKSGSFNNNGSFQFMRDRNHYRFAELPTMTELPYADDDLGFCLMLPHNRPKQFSQFSRSPTEEIESRLYATEFDGSLKLMEANLNMPRFTITRRHELKNRLDGLEFLFESGADLSGITTESSSVLEVGQMTHVATIEVNEEGVQVAAATYLTLINRPSSDKPLEFDLSRPFAFFLRFHPTGRYLVMGKVDRLDGTV